MQENYDLTINFLNSGEIQSHIASSRPLAKAIDESAVNLGMPLKMIPREPQLDILVNFKKSV